MPFQRISEVDKQRIVDAHNNNEICMLRYYKLKTNYKLGYQKNLRLALQRSKNLRWSINANEETGRRSNRTQQCGNQTSSTTLRSMNGVRR